MATSAVEDGVAMELAQHGVAQRVDDEEPSAEWGWHGSFPRAELVAGWASVLIILGMLVGNHTGQIENVWLLGIAAVMAAGLVRHSLKKRHAWRR